MVAAVVAVLLLDSAAAAARGGLRFLAAPRWEEGEAFIASDSTVQIAKNVGFKRDEMIRFLFDQLWRANRTRRNLEKSELFSPTRTIER